MKKISKSEIQNKYKIRWIFFGALVITLYFDTQSQDPFNSPKFWLLILFTSVLLGYVFSKKNKISIEDKRLYRTLSTLCILYLSVMLISSLFAYSSQVAFLGESFRRNGLLTYVGFLTFFIASVKFVRFENIFSGLQILSLAGLITGLYSLIQITGNDWVKWSSTNLVISTFGNTNFSGAGMTIFAIVVFGLSIINLRNKILFFLYFSTFIVLVYAVLQTNARQAVITLCLGLAIFSSLFLYRKNKKIWFISVVLMFFTLILSLLAVFKIGPLESIIYKNSISVRQYYWSAGIKMFSQNPFLGIGPDHYGIFFKEFRDPGYPLAYGWGITSSNAHNIVIQNFATGGIFLGVIYLIIQILIGYKSVCLIKSTVGNQQVVSTLLFSAWIAYQAQSLISIEFIGLSIWGWILGGALIGLSFQAGSLQVRNSSKSIELDIYRIVITSLLLLISFLIINPLRQIEKATWYLNIQVDSNNQQQVSIFDFNATKVIEGRFTNTEYKNLAAVNLSRVGKKDKAIALLLDSINKDPRNLDTLALLVDTYEKAGDFKLAIFYRSQIAKYDPWNAQNYLGLAQLYKVTNDPQNMSLMVNKILSFAASDPIAEVAKQEFGKISN